MNIKGKKQVMQTKDIPLYYIKCFDIYKNVLIKVIKTNL
jgi:hypothetical protein